ncbi:MAG: hypothetical protein AAFX39_06525 [Pseudomonadota bacterium]
MTKRTMGFLALATAALAAAMVPALAVPGLSRLDFATRPDATDAMPVVRVAAENGQWTSATDAVVTFSFVIDAMASQGRITHAVIGVPGVYVGPDRSIVADGQAIWFIDAGGDGRLTRRVERTVAGSDIPTLSSQATAACNRLIDRGATTTTEMTTEILGRARIAIAVEPKGAAALIADRTVETSIIRFLITVVCAAETDPMTS